jgi:hypothetical protein
LSLLFAVIQTRVSKRPLKSHQWWLFFIPPMDGGAALKRLLSSYHVQTARAKQCSLSNSRPLFPAASKDILLDVKEFVNSSYWISKLADRISKRALACRATLTCLHALQQLATSCIESRACYNGEASIGGLSGIKRILSVPSKIDLNPSWAGRPILAFPVDISTDHMITLRSIHGYCMYVLRQLESTCDTRQSTAPDINALCRRGR